MDYLLSEAFLCSSHRILTCVGISLPLPSSCISRAKSVTLGPLVPGLPLIHPSLCGVSGFTQPDAHPGPSGKRPAVLPCLPAQSTGTLAGHRLSPFPHTHSPTQTHDPPASTLKFYNYMCSLTLRTQSASSPTPTECFKNYAIN